MSRAAHHTLDIVSFTVLQSQAGVTQSSIPWKQYIEDLVQAFQKCTNKLLWPIAEWPKVITLEYLGQMVLGKRYINKFIGVGTKCRSLCLTEEEILNN